MRVAFVYPDLWSQGGYPRDIRSLMGAFSEAVQIVPIPLEPDQTPAEKVRALRSACSQKAIDMAHVFGMFIPTLPILTLILRRFEIPYVMSPMAALMPFALKRHAVRKRLFITAFGRSMLQGASRIHTFGPCETESVARITRVGTAFEAPLGVYFDDIPNRLAPATRRREFLFFGRLDTYQKGLDLLLCGYARYLRESPAPIPLRIAGLPYRMSDRWLRREVRRLNLADSVSLQFDVSSEDKYALLRSALALIYPSRYDGPPRPLREALALGTPILASRESNIFPTLEREGWGISFDATVDGVATALHRFELSMPRSSMTAVDSVLSWKAVASLYEREYLSLGT